MLSDDDMSKIGFAARIVRVLIVNAGAGLSAALKHRGMQMSAAERQQLQLAREVLALFITATAPAGIADGLADAAAREMVRAAVEALDRLFDAPADAPPTMGVPN